MHPVLAIFLTGFLVVAAYSSGNQLTLSERSQLAATGSSDNQAIQANAKLQANYKTDAADQQCPAASGNNVYRSDKPRNSNFSENGTIYNNLYGKPCESDYVKAYCSAAKVCNGGLLGSKCFDGLMWRDCKIGDPQVRDLQQVADLNNSGLNLSGPQDQPVIQPQTGRDQFNNVESTQPAQNQTGVGDAYRTPTPVSNQIPAQPPTNSGQLDNIANNPAPAQQSGATQYNQAGTGQVAAQPQKTLTPPQSPQQTAASPPKAVAANNPSPTAQNTFKPNNPSNGTKTAVNSNPNTSGSAKTGGSIGNSGPKTNVSGTKSNTFSNTVRNVFTGGLDGYAIVNGITNLVSNLVSGGSRGKANGSSQQQVTQTAQNNQGAGTNLQLQQPIAVDQPNMQVQQSTGVNFGSTPIFGFSSELFGDEYRSRLVITNIIDIAGIPTGFSDDAGSGASGEDAAGGEQSDTATAITQMLEADSASPPQYLVVAGISEFGSSTSMEIKDQFMSRAALQFQQEIGGSQNSFAPLPEAPRSRSIVEVFYAVSIPDILGTIARGSVDFILDFIKGEAPENPIVYTERDDAPIGQVPVQANPLLPSAEPGERAGRGATTAGGASSQQIPRKAEPVAFEERLRESPAAVFADASVAYQDASYVPVTRPLVTFDAIPVPERSAPVREADAAPKPDGAVKKVLRIVFPWFFGEMR